MRKGLARLVHREIIACWDKWSQSSLQQAENSAEDAQAAKEVEE